MEAKQRFLTAFNRLEKFTRVTYGWKGSYEEATFMARIYDIRVKKSNLVISSNANFDKISLAAKMRNLIVHNLDIAFPSESFTSDFESLVDRIISPKPLEYAMVKIEDIKSAALSDGLEEVLEKMKTNHLSNIPVFDNDRLIGVFSENTLYNQFCTTGEVMVAKDTPLSEVKDAISLTKNPSQYFSYLRRLDNIYQAKELFMNGFSSGKKLEMIFVTENGRENEPILGLVTVWDIQEAFA